MLYWYSCTGWWWYKISKDSINRNWCKLGLLSLRINTPSESPRAPPWLIRPNDAPLTPSMTCVTCCRSRDRYLRASGPYLSLPPLPAPVNEPFVVAAGVQLVAGYWLWRWRLYGQWQGYEKKMLYLERSKNQMRYNIATKHDHWLWKIREISMAIKHIEAAYNGTYLDWARDFPPRLSVKPT